MSGLLPEDRVAAPVKSFGFAPVRPGTVVAPGVVDLFWLLPGAQDHDIEKPLLGLFSGLVERRSTIASALQ
jgi:hypothetical protein